MDPPSTATPEVDRLVSTHQMKIQYHAYHINIGFNFMKFVSYVDDRKNIRCLLPKRHCGSLRRKQDMVLPSHSELVCLYFKDYGMDYGIDIVLSDETVKKFVDLLKAHAYFVCKLRYTYNVDFSVTYGHLFDYQIDPTAIVELCTAYAGGDLVGIQKACTKFKEGTNSAANGNGEETADGDGEEIDPANKKRKSTTPTCGSIEALKLSIKKAMKENQVGVVIQVMELAIVDAKAGIQDDEVKEAIV